MEKEGSKRVSQKRGRRTLTQSSLRGPYLLDLITKRNRKEEEVGTDVPSG